MPFRLDLRDESNVMLNELDLDYTDNPNSPLPNVGEEVTVGTKRRTVLKRTFFYATSDKMSPTHGVTLELSEPID